MRLVLAATLSPTYGVYSGFESFEHVAVRPGSEEYLDSEKYEVRSRRLDGPLLPMIARLNQARRENPALQRLDNVRFLDTHNDGLIAYAKRTDRNVVLTVVNLDPHGTQEGLVDIPGDLGLPPAFTTTDLLDGAATTGTWAATTCASRPTSAPATSCGWTPRERADPSGRPLRGAPEAGTEPGRSPAARTHWFESDPLWFKRAVFYEIHLRGFFDGNADGSGDFRGLTEKLDYLQWLGVDCIWLLPILRQPAARRRLRHLRLLRRPPRLRDRSRTSARSSRPRTSAASASSPTSS